MLSEDMFLYPYRIGQLRDGALVFLGSYSDAFGPGRRMTGGTMSGRKSGRSPSGDLLILESTVQGGAAIRQYVRRQGKRFIPQAVLDDANGPVPETVIYRGKDCWWGRAADANLPARKATEHVA